MSVIAFGYDTMHRLNADWFMVGLSLNVLYESAYSHQQQLRPVEYVV